MGVSKVVLAVRIGRGYAIEIRVEPCLASHDYALVVRTTLGARVLVRDTIAMGLAMADAGTVTEPLGLVPSAPNLRPADILTRASTVDGFLACDVGIASPEASGAGLDCVESMRVRKLEHYGERVLMEPEAQNVRYTPLVLSCYGRRSTAQQAARTRDGSTAESLVRRWELEVAVDVWRRTAMIGRRCLPRPREVGPDTAWAAVLDEADASVDAWLHVVREA